MIYAESFVKDPDAVLDYVFDWRDWLSDTEIISTSSWTVETGLTQDGATNTDSTATVWLSGGTAGECYKITNNITTNGGNAGVARTDNRTMLIEVKER